MFRKILVCTGLSPASDAMIQCARDALSLLFLQPYAEVVPAGGIVDVEFRGPSHLLL